MLYELDAYIAIYFQWSCDCWAHYAFFSIGKLPYKVLYHYIFDHHNMYSMKNIDYLLHPFEEI